jgi:putative FmdB family regulatory protein
MPTYEYECRACGLRFERRQSITAPPLRRCPACAGPVERLVSGGGGFIVRTSGGGDSCALATTGRTCCGRAERCGEPRCGDER